MTTNLIYHSFPAYKTCSGKIYEDISISYQIFGREIHTAPIVLVHHALTGNSDVLSKEKGWWKDLIGENKRIDTNKYTIIAFNFLGNGYDGTTISSYEDFSMKDIAILIYNTLKDIGVKKVYANIGGSIGGSLAWYLAVITDNFIDYTIPVASDWKATDWILGYCKAQKDILAHSSRPLNDARIMAMLLYRTPKSLNDKFQRTKNQNAEFNISAWLSHHGNKLENRFILEAYKMMNHLVSTIDISENGDFEITAKKIDSTIIQIAIDSDLFFLKEENIATSLILDKLNIPNKYYEVNSIHGHDGFLIEHKQISNILKSIFK